MTLQEAFDKIYEGTRTQKTRAADGCGDCVFITRTGERCFLGMLLTEQQARDASAQAWSSMRIAEVTGLRAHQATLIELMGIHDAISPARWDKELEKLASENGCTYPPKEA